MLLVQFLIHLTFTFSKLGLDTFRQSANRRCLLILACLFLLCYEFLQVSCFLYSGFANNSSSLAVWEVTSAHSFLCYEMGWWEMGRGAQSRCGTWSSSWRLFSAQSTCVLVQYPKDKIPETGRMCLAWKSFYFASYRFVEEKSSFEYGQVNHALAAAMRTLIKEYMILITQLEHLQRQGLLSLQKLWFYIQPTMRTLEILASLGEFQKCSHCVLTGASGSLHMVPSVSEAFGL